MKEKFFNLFFALIILINTQQVQAVNKFALKCSKAGSYYKTLSVISLGNELLLTMVLDLTDEGQAFTVPWHSSTETSHNFKEGNTQFVVNRTTGDVQIIEADRVLLNYSCSQIENYDEELSAMRKLNNKWKDKQIKNRKF
jgi:hypothetical protein